MNLFQRIAAWFGRDYVLVYPVEGCGILIKITRVMWIVGKPLFFVDDHGFCELMSDGSIFGFTYFKHWKPITPCIRDWAKLVQRCEGTGSGKESYTATGLGFTPPNPLTLVEIQAVKDAMLRRQKP